MNPQQQQQDNRKRAHSSSSSSNSRSGSPLTTIRNSSDSSNSSNTSSIRKKRHTGNVIASDSSSSAESSSNPSFSSSSSFFYSSSSSTPPRLTAQRSVPAFLNKLFNMVEDVSTNSLVRWSKGGSSFIVEKHEEFAKTVLPRFYKHNTFASFVRQLNMYDFHKVPHIQQGVLIAENEHDLWEFSNPNFQRGRPDLLILVTRKRNRDRDTADNENVNVATLLQSLNMLKKHQSTISNDLKDLHRDNEILWQETLTAREKYQKHQEAIEKILQFLTAIFSNDNPAITMNNPDLLPKGLIEEAASLAGMPINKLNIDQKLKSPSSAGSIPLNSNLTTSALSNIVSSVLRLYSSQPRPSSIGIDQNQRPDLPKTTNVNNNSSVSLTDFSQTLNTATKSAQSITQDIDTLQLNIESLANDLGIDPNQFDDDLNIRDNYQQMLKSNHSSNFIELNDFDEDKDDNNFQQQQTKRPFQYKNLNKHLQPQPQQQPQQQQQQQQRPRLQRQIRDGSVYNFRNYMPQPQEISFNTLPPTGYYPPVMDTTNNPAFVATNGNNNTIIDNPYIVPYYNNNTNEENYDENT